MLSAGICRRGIIKGTQYDKCPCVSWLCLHTYCYRISFNVVSNAVIRSKRSDREAPRVQAHTTPRIIFPVEFSVIRITSIQRGLPSSGSGRLGKIEYSLTVIEPSDYITNKVLLNQSAYADP